MLEKAIIRSHEDLINSETEGAHQDIKRRRREVQRWAWSGSSSERQCRPVLVGQHVQGGRGIIWWKMGKDWIFFLCKPFLIFIQFVIILLQFFVLLSWPQGMWDLSSQTRDWTQSFHWKAKSQPLDHQGSCRKGLIVEGPPLSDFGFAHCSPNNRKSWRAFVKAG